MLISKNCLVFAVDGANISVFRNVGTAFEPVLDLIEETSAPVPRSSELGKDKPGRSSQSATVRKSAVEGSDLHQQAEDLLARQAAQQLDSRSRNTKDGIVLVAAPRTLGMIRKHYKRETSESLTAEIAKDFGPQDAESLAKMLAQYEKGSR